MSKSKRGEIVATKAADDTGGKAGDLLSAQSVAVPAGEDRDAAFYEQLLRLDLIEIACRHGGTSVADARPLADRMLDYLGDGAESRELRLACLQHAADLIRTRSLWSWDLVETADAFEAYARAGAAEDTAGAAGERAS